MRIAFLANPESPNGWYRGIGPMVALAGRGHEIRQLLRPGGGYRPHLLDGCDVLHIHRQHDEEALRLARRAHGMGIVVAWDNDDDLASVPRKTIAHREWGGAKGARLHLQQRSMIQLADLVTAPSRRLVERFQDEGARHVALIENYVRDEMATYPLPARRTGAPVVIGWLAGKEHHTDAERLPIRAALERLLAAHREIEVRTIGAGLGLRDPRYHHVRAVLFTELEQTLAQLDVGLAPIADTPFNRARSNVKLKEYAVVGVPWLASPIGPYAAHGERQGGRLVPDDGWYDALERIVVKERLRRKLARRARRWGVRQTVSENASRWEQDLATVARTA